MQAIERAPPMRPFLEKDQSEGRAEAGLRRPSPSLRHDDLVVVRREITGRRSSFA
jgi:hypothetical protein